MGTAASTLGIKPLIMLKEGEIFPTGVTRNRKKGLKRLIEQAKIHFEKIGESPNDYRIVVGYGYDYEEVILPVDFIRSISCTASSKESPACCILTVSCTNSPCSTVFTAVSTT